MKMNKKTVQNLSWINTWLKVNLERMQNRIVGDGGKIYVVDGKHRFLGYGDWAWNLQDQREIGDLIDDYELCSRPRWVPKSWTVDAFRERVGYKPSLPTIELTAPVTRRQGSPIAEYREELQQYILNTYYPN